MPLADYKHTDIGADQLPLHLTPVPDPGRSGNQYFLGTDGEVYCVIAEAIGWLRWSRVEKEQK
jgi:hypothetical protein